MNLPGIKQAGGYRDVLTGRHVTQSGLITNPFFTLGEVLIQTVRCRLLLVGPVGLGVRHAAGSPSGCDRVVPSVELIQRGQKAGPVFLRQVGQQGLLRCADVGPHGPLQVAAVGGQAQQA
jgi:hypothetical protein